MDRSRPFEIRRSVDHLNAHTASRSLDHPASGVDARGVEVSHLLVADVLDLGLSHGSNLVPVGNPRPLGDSGGLLQQGRSRRALGIGVLGVSPISSGKLVENRLEVGVAAARRRLSAVES